MKIAIIGAAELGKLIAYHAVNDSGFEVAGYYDDFFKQKEFNDKPVFGNTSIILNDFEKGVFDKLIVAIGYSQMNARADVYNKFKGRIPFANIIHSSCYIDKSCLIGEGNFFLPGAVLDYGVIIHNNITLNTATVIAHHSEVCDHTFIAPGVTIAGLVKIEQRCFIGIGSIIKDCIIISENCTIGAGAVVLENTVAFTTSIGIPAEAIKSKL
ncbi:MAG: acetyltransferase [Bacteroidia bacterium]